MFTRRQFVGASMAGFAAVRHVRTVWPPTTTLAFIALGSATSANAESVRAGGLIGGGEVNQTAQLLHAAVAVQQLQANDAAEAHDVAARARAEGVIGFVAGGDSTVADALLREWSPNGAPIIVTSPLDHVACNAACFTAAPTTAEREAVLRQWRGADGNAAAQPEARVAAWSSNLVVNGADSLNQRFRAVWPHPPDESIWLQWFALKVMAESLLRSGAKSGAALRTALHETGADGHKGVLLQFDENRHLQQPLYVVAPCAGDGEWRSIYTAPIAADGALTGACA